MYCPGESMIALDMAAPQPRPTKPARVSEAAEMPAKTEAATPARSDDAEAEGTAPKGRAADFQKELDKEAGDSKAPKVDGTQVMVAPIPGPVPIPVADVPVTAVEVSVATADTVGDVPAAVVAGGAAVAAMVGTVVADGPEEAPAVAAEDVAAPSGTGVSAEAAKAAGAQVVSPVQVASAGAVVQAPPPGAGQGTASKEETAGSERDVEVKAEHGPTRSSHTAASATPAVATFGETRVADSAVEGGAARIVADQAGGMDWRLSTQASAAPLTTPRETVAQQAVQPQAVLGQITLAMSKSKDKTVEIRLDPPELGRVHIQLTQTEHGLRASVMAERPETHDLLRRHADALARDLGAAGYDKVSLDFSAGQRQAPREDEQKTAPRGLGYIRDEAVSASVAPVGSSRILSGDSLDIRL